MTNQPLPYFLSSILLLMGLSALAQPNPSGYIHGNISMDSSFEQTAYLCYISDFNEMYSMSSDMILDIAPLDKDGKFTFDLNFLPIETNLYRIHLVKKGDYPASLIIGGKEENHFFLFADRKSTIDLSNTIPNHIPNIQIAKPGLNQQLQALMGLGRSIDSTEFGQSAVKRDFIHLAIKEKYRFIADTCSQPLLSLFAIYKSNFVNEYALNPQFYQNYNSKWSSEKSAYFSAFRSLLPKEKSSYTWLYYFLIGFLCLGFGFFIGHKSNSLSTQKPRINDLSVQERKIFHLVQQGMSNQEISDQCHIGVSTVKSHLTSIYAKLQIKSRKEAMNLIS